MFHDKGKRKRITRRAYFLQRLVLEQELEVGMQVFAGACGNFPRRRWLSGPACRPAGGKWSDRHRIQRPLPSAGQRLLCVLLLDSTMATATRRRTEGAQRPQHPLWPHAVSSPRSMCVFIYMQCYSQQQSPGKCHPRCPLAAITAIYTMPLSLLTLA